VSGISISKRAGMIMNQGISLLEKTYGVTILIAAIKGRRWGFSGDFSNKEIAVVPSRRIQLNQNTGAVVYGWYDLDVGKQRELERKLLDLGDNSA